MSVGHVVIIGPPGAGKGTQAKLLCSKAGLHHISTGDLLRQEIADKSDLGLAAESYVQQGKLVPDNVVKGMIENLITQNGGKARFLFDGFPRNAEQAIVLDKFLSDAGEKIVAAISLFVPEEELVKRIAGRQVEQPERVDDSLEVFKKRLKIHHEQTAPVLRHYQQQNILVSINGFQSTDEVAAEISKVLEAA